MKIIGVIPARLSSSRLPHKMLADIGGKPLIQHTYENALKSELFEQLLVATDSREIEKAVSGFGGVAVMTSESHRSGTDRVAEAVRDMECDIVVNIQGDEISVPKEAFNLAVRVLAGDIAAVMGTVAYPISNPDEYYDRNTVKVIINKKSRALFFSRAPIPHSKSGKMPASGSCYHHVGIYSYRKGFLSAFTVLPPSSLEEDESLEQLRALDHGYIIKVGVFHTPTIKIDTPEDLDKARGVL